MDGLSWLAEDLGLPVVEETPDGRIRANAPAREILGGSTVESLPMAVSMLLGVSARDPALVELLERAREGERASAVIGAKRLGGERWRIFAMPAQSVANESSRAVRLACVPLAMADMLTLHRRAAAMDLAAGAAHEVANALSAIIGWAQMGRIPPRVPAATQDALDLIERSARDAWASARAVLGAARDVDDTRSSVLDATAIIEETVRLLHPAARAARVSLDAHIAPGLNVRGTAGALRTVVWNLLKNAIEAVSEAGHIRVDANARDSTCVIVVADDGPGMTDTKRIHLFDPYFTTKDAGTGLGLALVRRSVEGLGGTVTVKSARGRGARFTVELPLARAQRSVREPRQAMTIRRASGIREVTGLEGARILVVEDDLALRELMTTLLGLRSADAVAVGSAREALALSGPFDLALIDLVLPDERGDILLAALRAQGHVEAGIVVTGAASAPEWVNGGHPDEVLRKPFEPDDLVEIITRVMGTRAQRAAEEHG